MIKFPLLLKKDLQVFDEKYIVIYGMSSRVHVMIELLKFFQCKKVALYSSSVISKKDFCLATLKGVTVVSPNHLEQFTKKHSNVLLQCAFSDAEHISKMLLNTEKLNVETSPLIAGELINSFSYLTVFNTLQNPIKSCLVKNYWKSSCKNKIPTGLSSFEKPPIFLCLPQKTADYALMNTFEQIGDVSCFNVWHRPGIIGEVIAKKIFNKVKIITAVREPISQNLSSFYQILSESKIGYNWIYGELEGKTKKEKQEIIANYKELLENNGDNIQLLWDAYTKRFISTEHRDSPTIIPNTMQSFVSHFSKHVLDITAYPFDREKGYGIIKHHNIEIFVYQLEKLNSLVPELSEWVGVPFNALAKGNDAADKWIGESYKQAQKELVISQAYFDACFDEAYVKHCYSAADIERFKARWRTHIQ